MLIESPRFETVRQAETPEAREAIASLFRAAFDRCIEGDAALLLLFEEHGKPHEMFVVLEG